MPVELYFATRRVYQPDEVIQLAHSPHLANAHPDWHVMEDAFEAARPAALHSRKTSRYACSTIEDCLTYYAAQPGGHVRRIYKVLMEDPTSVPMALAGRGLHHSANPAILAEIATEYWTKERHEWEYLEYLAPQMKVVAVHGVGLLSATHDIILLL